VNSEGKNCSMTTVQKKKKVLKRQAKAHIKSSKTFIGKQGVKPKNIVGAPRKVISPEREKP